MELDQSLQKFREALTFKRNRFSSQAAREELVHVKIARFSSKDRERLDEEKYLIYPINHMTIRDMEAKGLKVSKPWPLHDLGVLDEPSIPSEVAFNPQQFLIPDSLDATEDIQERLITIMDLEIIDISLGISVMTGSPADYIELAQQHFEATGVQLFEGISTRTTAGYRGLRAAVGDYTQERGYQIRAVIPEVRYGLIGMAPLIVPGEFY